MSGVIEREQEPPPTLDDGLVRAANRAARKWEAGEAGPIVLGNEAHKRAFQGPKEGRPA